MLTPEQAQAVLDALPTPVFFKDRAGRYQGCNRAFAELTGKAMDELVGRSVFELWPPELAQAYYDADEALMAGSGEQRYETQIQRPDGERRDVLFYKAVLRDTDGRVTGLVGTLLDITERKQLEQRLAEQAERDALTGLLNRRGILACLETLCQDRRHHNASICLLVCDIDHFKSVNDRHGHAAGDEVLRATAQRLRLHLREADRVGRIGGEEFLVVLHDADLDAARHVAERLRAAVADERIPVDGQPLAVTLSIGLARSEPRHEDWKALMKRADAALYQAKRLGRNRIVLSEAPAGG